jgi:hypothetical protein
MRAKMYCHIHDHYVDEEDFDFDKDMCLEAVEEKDQSDCIFSTINERCYQ